MLRISTFIELLQVYIGMMAPHVLSQPLRMIGVIRNGIKHIHSVVRDEVGLTMVLTPSTIFEAEESGFSDDIRMADQELRG